ncbi:hypothetical protein PC9H_001584 [Pleurotus ostreatus]|uniref:Uncharacterized protein n=1 Tax=Pleurotus ostreatus TaxID=5322 RepID=A0A8H7A357_PLEOS|nr:uncharacterized protein PC9H_001584 [Pleurotus ostreatus]KAF7441235.1 hypothetical protein PC9H_001584 [Pleurotus ostreatus]
MGIPSIIISNVLQKKYRLKYVMVFGMVLTVAGTALSPFADSRGKYWGFAFPGLLLGASGVTVVFTTSNIAVVKVTPPQIAGTVGTTSGEVYHGGPTGYSGRAAGFWFLFALVCLLALCRLVFIKNTIPPVKKNVEEEKEKMAAFETSRDVEDGSS